MTRPSIPGRSEARERPLRPIPRLGLQGRILSLVVVGLLAVVGLLGVSSILAVNESVERALQERLAFARSTAGHLDYMLRQNQAYLDRVASSANPSLTDGDLTEAKAELHQAFLQTIFSNAVYILDEQGVVVWAEPQREQAAGLSLSEQEPVVAALTGGKPGISGALLSRLTGSPVVSMLTPLKDSSGKIVGLVGGEIDLRGNKLLELLQPAGLGASSYIQIIDGAGTVLASTRPGQVLQMSDHRSTLATLIREGKTTFGTCHDCHQLGAGEKRENEVMAFAPTSAASWGVLIRQDEAEALAPARQLRDRAFLLGLPLLVVSIALGWGVAQSVVRPLGSLTASAERISAGDLSQAIPTMGTDEIGRLARALETMRLRLNASLEALQRWNRELEERVRERTRELEESREQIRHSDAARGELLRKVISAQEEERRRIARELHDDTSQALTALALALETSALAGKAGDSALQPRLDEIRALALRTLEGVHNIIFDLRPSMLDDLGLVSAVRWYLESRLEPLGVRTALETTGTEQRLPGEIETALFRIIQEAISNVAKHARAENASVSIDFRSEAVVVEVEDDGVGFNAEEVTGSLVQSRSLGLLGMRERVSLLGGRLEVHSEPGGGTQLRVEVPLKENRHE